MPSTRHRSRIGALAAAAVVATVLLSPGLRAAEGPLPAGKVDRTLESIVLNGGYVDDSFYTSLAGHRSGDVYVLAELAAPADDATLLALTAAGARVRHTYTAIPWVAFAAPAGAVRTIASMPQVARLEADTVLDVLVDSADAASATQAKRGTGDVGATALWDQGITGSGVTVGVADTGGDGTHPDLDDLDFRAWDAPAEPKLGWFRDCVEGDTTVTGCRDVPAYDDNGHGTHVSGIAAGSAEGGSAEQRGMYPGIAPGASLAVAKVMTGAGTGLNSDVMKGFELLATEKPEGAGADVINASLGSSRAYGAPIFYASQVTNTSATAILVNQLAVKNNVVFTISAGNSGPTMQSIGSPGVASQALTVGASVADFDLDADVADTVHGEWGNTRPEAAKAGASALADFSSRGPSGDRLIKPDITAPGVYWVAPESTEGAEVRALDAGHNHFFSGDPTYAVLSGTSMSAPAAAGATALVIDGWNRATNKAPWRYYDVKAALVNTAGDRSFEGPVSGAIGTIQTKVEGKTPKDVYLLRNAEWTGVTGEGAGRIDAGRAITALTQGIIAHTIASGPVDDVHELQPSWSMDELAPGESSSTTFELRSGPLAKTGTTKVTFSSAPEPQAKGVQPIPRAWLSLPRTTHVPRGGVANVGFTITVPAGAAPGLYAGIVSADADLGGGVSQHLRIPAQLYVPLADTDLGTGSTAIVDRDDLWASDTTDYGVVGSQSILADVFSDWIAYPVRVPAGTTSVTVRAFDPDGADTLDLFVFDDKGEEIDSTVSLAFDHGVPAGAALAPTGSDAPAVVTLFDGNDNAEPKDVRGTTVWVVVTDTKPADPGTFSAYHLAVNIVDSSATQLAPAARIHSGDHAWWSTSALGATTRLTKSVTIPAGSPQLKFWTFYELEDGYDFTHVLASTDNGTTWDALATAGPNGEPGTTALDPIGLLPLTDRSATYADGFTGVSGQSPSYSGQQLAAGALVQQVADLSAYAGKQILLRFEYRADAGTSWAGFYLDDIEIPGQTADTAETNNGWSSDGFVLVTKEQPAT